MIVFVGLSVLFVRKFNTFKSLSCRSNLEAGSPEEEGAEVQQRVYTISQENPGFLHSREDVREVKSATEVVRDTKTTIEVERDAKIAVEVVKKADSRYPPRPSLELCQASRSLYI